MAWKFDSNLPIYIQIMNKIKQEIVSKELAVGERLPSVREYAEIAGVNPNTIQRSLSELEKEGFIYTNRTAGRYVTDNEALISEARQALALEELKRFVGTMEKLAYPADELANLVNTYLKGSYNPWNFCDVS